MENAPAKPVEIVTANRLRDGVVLYWRQGGWCEALAEAEHFADPAAAKAALAEAAAFVQAREVVNPYAFKARIEGGIAVPVEEREVIRASGPSVVHMGKQADPALAPHFPRAGTPPAPKPASGPEAFDVSL